MIDRGTPLEARDYDALAARWITRELADSAMLRRVDDIEGSTIVGKNGLASYSGQLIPYLWPGIPCARAYRLRRDHPEIQGGKVKNKYMAEPGASNKLYFGPCDPALLADTSIPAAIVEGEYKTLALHGLSLHQSDRPRFLALGLSGVWNWRGRTGKTVDADGARVDEVGPIPDLSRIEWKGRQTIIIFDRDLETNDSVRWARDGLTKELRARGARVVWFSWPKDILPEAKGVDDLLSAVGPERVLEMMANPEIATDPKRETDVAELAREITATDHFARDAGDRLYVFKDGVYRPTGERFIAGRVKELYETWGLSAKWSVHKSTEVIEYIRVDRPELWADPPADVINVLNGLLNVHTRELRPHTHKFYSAVQIPVRFDPAARCEAWDKFISEVFPRDSEAIAWEILAWLMTPRNNIQKAVLLLGEGSNGKSTYLRACIVFIGKCNTSALSLHKLEQDKFSAARLIGKLANICPDLPNAHLSVTSMFKALTGGDVINAEFKFKDSFEFTPFCKLIFSSNKPPSTDDATHGFFRRWQVIPFDKAFEEGAAGTAKPEDLDARLANPAELSGVLNKALHALGRIQHGGFTQSESMKTAWEEFRSVTDPLVVWLDQHTVTLPNVMIPQATLINAFNKHLADTHKAVITKKAFGQALRRARPEIVDSQRTFNGKAHTWVYEGITIRTAYSTERRERDERD